MLSINASNQQALEDRGIDARDFVSVFARRRDDGTEVSEHFWSDVGNISAPVVNPLTGDPVARNFVGAYGLVEIDAIPRVHNVTIQTITMSLNYINDDVMNLFMLYDVKLARVEIFRGLYVLGTRQLAAPAFPRFVGFVNNAPMDIPEENSEGSLKFECVSHTAELTRPNYETRSYENQMEREDGDEFYKDTATIGEMEFFWGRHSAKVSGGDPSSKPK